LYSVISVCLNNEHLFQCFISRENIVLLNIFAVGIHSCAVSRRSNFGKKNPPFPVYPFYRKRYCCDLFIFQYWCLQERHIIGFSEMKWCWEEALGTDHLTCRWGLWFFVPLKNFFSDNTRDRIFIFFVALTAKIFSRI
jgi:hypothetical protein